MGEPAGKQLYERDFYAWTQDQAKRLRALAGDNRFDVDNVAGEIEDLGASALGAVKSHVENVFVHVLNLTRKSHEGAARVGLRVVAGEIVGAWQRRTHPPRGASRRGVEGWCDPSL